MKKLFLLLGLVAIIGVSCDIDDQVDPNNPSVNSVLNDADIAELNLLVTGISSQMREGLEIYVTASGSIARELYKFDADPRNTEDLLGKEGLTLDNNTFYLTGWYIPFYRTIKTCNTLIEAADNSTQISEAQRNGYKGFANTVAAYQMLRSVAMLGCNGLRTDVADPVNLGPFQDEVQAYRDIRTLFDTANGQLGGAEFAFSLSSGFAGLDTPAGFAQFNRALAARAALYDNDYAGALNLLGSTFMDMGGDLQTGANHVFSTSGNDLLNPLFKATDQNGDQIIVHDQVIADIEAGDARMDKFFLRPDPTSQDGLNGTHSTGLYASNTASVSIIRNEELVLIHAEASIQTGDLAGAVNSINVIRSANGLSDYAGDQTEAALTTEMLNQRRYSLWGEGHRMFDLRRYGLLNANDLPIDRAGDQVFDHFPIPLAEAEPNKC